MKFILVTALSKREGPPVVGRVKAILDKQLNGRLFTTMAIADMVGASPETMHHNNRFFDDYSHVQGHQRWWGNKVTIKQLRKEMKKRDNYK